MSVRWNELPLFGNFQSSFSFRRVIVPTSGALSCTATDPLLVICRLPWSIVVLAVLLMLFAAALAVATIFREERS